MNRLLIAILYFGLTSCGNQKAEQEKINQKTLPDNSVTAPTTISRKTNYATTFAANKVTEIGKEINCIFQDINYNYWFATNGEGVYSYDGKTLIQFTTKDGLSDNQVFTIQEDKQGDIWFVTVGGINRFDGKTFSTFRSKDNKELLSEKDLRTEPDDLWFGFAGGAYRYNARLPDGQGNSFSYLLLPNSKSDAKHFNPTNPQNPDSRKLNSYSVYCSLKDKSGNLWLGTQTQGVCRYDGKTFTWFSEKGLSGPAVRALFEDSNGNLWFGNNGNGLFRYDASTSLSTGGKTLTNFTEEKGLGNPEFLKTGKSGPGTLARVWTINEDNIGNIWIGTYDAGAWRYDPSASLRTGSNNLTNYTTKDGITSNAINTIYKDKKGELWFGTDGAGVCKFNGISFSSFTFKP
ncbi:MAG: two-component regulator propeller domain-containing protein [Bacteroidia bacterium]